MTLPPELENQGFNPTGRHDRSYWVKHLANMTGAICIVPPDFKWGLIDPYGKYNGKWVLEETGSNHWIKLYDPDDVQSLVVDYITWSLTGEPPELVNK